MKRLLTMVKNRRKRKRDEYPFAPTELTADEIQPLVRFMSDPEYAGAGLKFMMAALEHLESRAASTDNASYQQ